VARKRHSPESIAAVLRRVEIAERARKAGVHENTVHLWKKKYGQLCTAEIREINELRDENSRLKRLVAASQLHVCTALRFNRKSIRYQSKRNPFNEALLVSHQGALPARVRYGQRRIYVLRREGWLINQEAGGTTLSPRRLKPASKSAQVTSQLHRTQSAAGSDAAQSRLEHGLHARPIDGR
jgi:putative transposase